MPLTLQIFGSSPDDHGHLIIDRKNIIITYSKDESKLRKISSNRKRFSEALNETPIKSYLSREGNFAMPEDPRHDVLEHKSSYDRRHTVHLHLILRENVSFEHIKIIFNNLPLLNISDLLSETCRNYILSTAKEYFLELENSPLAQAAEFQYREEKKRDYQIAEAEVLGNQLDEVDLDFNLQMTNPTQSLRLSLMTPGMQHALPEMNSSVRIEEISDTKPLINNVVSNESDKQEETDSSIDVAKGYAPTRFFFHETVVKQGMEETRKLATEIALHALERSNRM